MEDPNIKFHAEICPVGAALIHADRQTDERNEANRPIFDYANEPNKVKFSCKFMSHCDSIIIRYIKHCYLDFVAKRQCIGTLRHYPFFGAGFRTHFTQFYMI